MKNSRRNRRIIGVTASLLFLFVVSLTGGAICSECRGNTFQGRPGYECTEGQKGHHEDGAR